MVKKTALLLVVMFIFVACASKYYSLTNRINYAVTPADIFSLSIDIATSDISADEKRKLSMQLTKRSLSVFSLYIKFYTDKKQLPPKDDILNMLQYVKDNLDTLTDKETISELQKMTIKLASLLKKSYFR